MSVIAIAVLAAGPATVDGSTSGMRFRPSTPTQALAATSVRDPATGVAAATLGATHRKRPTLVSVGKGLTFVGLALGLFSLLYARLRRQKRPPGTMLHGPTDLQVATRLLVVGAIGVVLWFVGDTIHH